MLVQILWLPFQLLRALIVPFLTLLLCTIILLFYKLYIRPKYRMRHYIKQGHPTLYFPILGFYVNQESDLQKHGDCEYFIKNRARESPSRLLCTNFVSNAHVLLFDPVLIKEFYMNNDCYVKADLGVRIYKSLLGTGLISSEGAEWKKQRKILSNVFHFEFLKSIVPEVQSTAHQNLLSLQKTGLNNIDIMDEFQRTTGEVVGKIFFGEMLNKFQFEGKNMTTALAILIQEIATQNQTLETLVLGPAFIEKGIFPHHKKLMNKVAAFRKVCADIVKERKQERETKKQNNEPVKEAKFKDMLDVLLDYKGDDSARMTDEEIIDQFCSFFLAGMDTTGHFATFCLWYLHKYPEIKIKITEELKKFYNPNVQVTTDSLNQLDYMTAFIKESLRFATPAIGIFPRRAIKDHMLKDVSIKTGDIVNLTYFYNNFNPEYFPDPDNFNPDRWLGNEKLSDAYAFTPFSAGPRNCIGQHLAMNETRILLAEFLIMYDYELPQGYEMKMRNRFLYSPHEDLHLNLKVKSA